MSLISGFFPNLIISVTFLLLLSGVDWRAHNRRQHLATAATKSLISTAVLARLQLEFHLVPYVFPLRYYAWVAGVFFALSLCVYAQRIGWWRRTLSIAAVPLMTLTAAVLINSDFQAYPTFASLVGSGAQHETTLVELFAKRNQNGLRPNGSTRALAGGTQLTSAIAAGTVSGESAKVTIPGTRSHFSTRPAWVWVPPAYMAGQVDHLPVLMLLGGSPGRTNDWLRAGFADRAAGAFAARHNGLAPILIMPDANGSVTGDTECVDGSAGNAETYLTVDVPAFMHREFGAPLGRSFSVAGFSEGGTCAVMLATRHPDLFTGFADFSGLTSPSLTERVNAKETAVGLFRGSMKDYLAHDPLELLRAKDLRGGAYFEVGRSDTLHVHAQRQLAALARAAGLTVCAREVPGGHTYGFWAQALVDALPTLAGELKITPLPTPHPDCALSTATLAPGP